ncbi:MAG: hypothetical protein ABI725_01260 [Chloroflexota bacterium]
MPFVRTTPVVTCPDWHHRKSVVRSNGPYERNGRHYRRYQCRPRIGKPHYFSVLLDTEEPRPTARWQTPPSCPNHKGSRVVRDGVYGKSGRTTRQCYRCTHETCNEACKPGCKGRHRFTPDLPRAYVGRADDENVCAICGEPRNVHHGEHANARRHGWSDRMVARALVALSVGETYGDAGAWAQRQRPKRKQRTITNPTGKKASTAAANNRWHVPADWVEVHGPAIWEPLDAKLREQEREVRKRVDEELAAGLPLRRPLVWIADELPINGKGNVLLFNVLVIAEGYWIDGRDEPVLRLRLARAMPDRTTAAWLLAFDELAGSGPDEIWPDVIVSDAGTGLTAAIRRRFGGRTRWVPSVWHIAQSVRKLALGKSPMRNRTPFPDLEAHLSLLNRSSWALSTVASWKSWWDELEVILAKNGVKGKLGLRRRIFEPGMADAIPYLGSGGVAIGSGGIEELVKRRIKPLFAEGRVTFTSIERTNRLTDLAVARDQGWLDDEVEVAKLVRSDTRPYGGWAPAPRMMADVSDPATKKRYRSLRDRTLPLRLARAKGLM